MAIVLFLREYTSELFLHFHLLTNVLKTLFIMIFSRNILFGLLNENQSKKVNKKLKKITNTKLMKVMFDVSNTKSYYNMYVILDDYHHTSISLVSISRIFTQLLIDSLSFCNPLYERHPRKAYKPAFPPHPPS